VSCQVIHKQHDYVSCFGLGFKRSIALTLEFAGIINLIVSECLLTPNFYTLAHYGYCLTRDNGRPLVYDHAQCLGLQAIQKFLQSRLVRLLENHHSPYQLGQRRHQGCYCFLARIHHKAGPVILKVCSSLTILMSGKTTCERLFTFYFHFES